MLKGSSTAANSSATAVTGDRDQAQSERHPGWKPVIIQSASPVRKADGPLGRGGEFGRIERRELTAHTLPPSAIAIGPPAWTRRDARQ